MLTLEKIKDRVKKVKDMSGDDELAHGEEDGLYIDFVRHVSKYPRDEDLCAMAKEVLKTRRIDFGRWCA